MLEKSTIYISKLCVVLYTVSVYYAIILSQSDIKQKALFVSDKVAQCLFPSNLCYCHIVAI